MIYNCFIVVIIINLEQYYETGTLIYIVSHFSEQHCKVIIIFFSFLQIKRPKLKKVKYFLKSSYVIKVRAGFKTRCACCTLES